MTTSSARAFETLLTGRGLVESPRWHDDHLVFCDWTAGEVVGWAPQSSPTVLARPAGMPFCVDRLPGGDLVIVAGSALWTAAPDGTLSQYADLSGIAPTGWNDIVVGPDGTAFVNNIAFDFIAGEPARPGLIASVAADRTVRLVAEGPLFPNGMVVLPDRHTLVVAESWAGKLTQYPIHDNGGLGTAQTWAELPGSAPDGLCADASGAVWYADVPSQCCVRVAEGGEQLDRIDAPLGCFSCTLGGPDGQTLYVAAAAWPKVMDPGSRAGVILAARVDVPRSGWPA